MFTFQSLQEGMVFEGMEDPYTGQDIVNEATGE